MREQLLDFDDSVMTGYTIADRTIDSKQTGVETPSGAILRRLTCNVTGFGRGTIPSLTADCSAVRQSGDGISYRRRADLREKTNLLKQINPNTLSSP